MRTLQLNRQEGKSRAIFTATSLHLCYNPDIHTTKSRIDTVQSPGRGLVPVQSPFPEQCRFWITVCAGAVGGACALARIGASFKSAVSPSHSRSLLRYSGPDRVECSLAAGNNILLMKPNPNGKQSFPQGCYSTMLVAH